MSNWRSGVASGGELTDADGTLGTAAEEDVIIGCDCKGLAPDEAPLEEEGLAPDEGTLEEEGPEGIGDPAGTGD